MQCLILLTSDIKYHEAGIVLSVGDPKRVGQSCNLCIRDIIPGRRVNVRILD